MGTTLITNAQLVSDGRITPGDLLIDGERIRRIGSQLPAEGANAVIDARGACLFPGLIDDQVHFREPGLTHKAEIATESRAGLAGGITSYMEMPNTQPPALTLAALERKYERAAAVSRANYSFYLGASEDNVAEIQQLDPANICGVKIFLGASTGNLLVDDQAALERIFAHSPVLIATHCEDETTIRRNAAAMRERYGEAVPMREHPVLRNEEACWLSSSRAVQLAKETGARLHVLHISTARELALFGETGPVEDKQITCEACLHHLWFTDEDYERLGSRIKWNPAIKTAADRSALRQAVREGRIDVLATDHAPHTLAEKQRASYFETPAGGPLVQHQLPALFELHRQGAFSLEVLAERACHAPARMFRIQERGYLREGYFADLVLVDPQAPWTVAPENIAYKCGWSPFEGQAFQARVTHTFVNGQLAYHNGQFNEEVRGRRLRFAR